MAAAKHTQGDLVPAPLNRTDIARIAREVYGSERMGPSEEEFARRIERAAVQASGAADLLAALQTAEAILYAHGKPIDPAITAAIAKATGEQA